MTTAPAEPTYPTNPPVTPPGTPVEGVIYEDYWGTDETFEYRLGDGQQYFVIQPMNEGKKVMFQKKTNKGIKVNQRTQDAQFDVDPAGERHTLIKESVIDYFLMIRTPRTGGPGQPPIEFTKHPYSPRGLNEWLEKANPKTVQDLEFFIRTKNPWMQADMDVEEIDKEIERLYEMRKQALEEQAGEGSSASK